MIKIASFALALSLVSSPSMAHTFYNYNNGYYGYNHNYISASPVIPKYFGRKYKEIVRSFSGMVSYYGHGERLSRHTSDGGIFNPNGLTAAHRYLPFGTRLLITYNHHSVIVKVTDRGPGVRSRVLDLSYGAAKALGIIERGTANVQVVVLR